MAKHREGAKNWISWTSLFNRGVCGVNVEIARLRRFEKYRGRGVEFCKYVPMRYLLFDPSRGRCLFRCVYGGLSFAVIDTESLRDSFE